MIWQRALKRPLFNRYRDNVIRSLELLDGVDDAENYVKNYLHELEDKGLKPTLSMTDEYRAAEAEYAQKILQQMLRLRKFRSSATNQR